MKEEGKMKKLSIHLKDVSIHFSGKPILEIDELFVYENEKIGIIGKNGAGKSTLLNLIMGKIQSDKGKVQRLNDFHYLAQVAEEITNESEKTDKNCLLNQKNQKLSGGEKVQKRLATLFSEYPTGVILDEPTTHLDKEHRQLLVADLTYYYGTVLFVSHDRFFLNQLAEKIWEVSDGHVKEYLGNYDAYCRQKELEQQTQYNVYHQYQKEKKKLQESYTKKQAQAQKSSHVSKKQKQKQIKPSRLAGSKQKDTVQKALQKQAKAINARIDRLPDVAQAKQERKIIFPTNNQFSLYNPYPIRIENLTFAYGNRTILNQVNVQIPLNEKIALCGKNGAGKSTFLQQIEARHPAIYFSPKVRLGTYHQLDYRLKNDEPLLTYLLKRTNYSEKIVRSLLYRLGFQQENLQTKISSLSGGEAIKITLAQLFIEPNNIILLDEPTNFLDLDTIQALEEFISAYQGTVIFTSHDETFVEKVATRTIYLENGKIIDK
ncbi:TPA: ribosomal protection-like ABC-F family protein [Enterococcus faecalis]